MSAPSVFDIDSLLSPIAGANGTASVPLAERAELDEARKDKPDPNQPSTFVKPDWSKVVQRAREVLGTRSKDLVVAARLTEALFHQHGFKALGEGFRLLRLLVEECWDQLTPPIDEDGDVEPRAAALTWLCRSDRGACFPGTIRLRPLFHGKRGGYGFLEWQRGQKKRDLPPEEAAKIPIDLEDLDKAIEGLTAEKCAELAANLAQALEELDLLARSLAEKMGAEAPDTGELLQALQNCQGLIEQELRKKRPALLDEGAQSDGEEGAAAGEPARRTRAAATRAEAYRQLADAAAVLRELEPHSPIPYLIQRAVELGALPFPDMIKELIREQNVLAELRRELGIKGPADSE